MFLNGRLINILDVIKEELRLGMIYYFSILCLDKL